MYKNVIKNCIDKKRKEGKSGYIFLNNVKRKKTPIKTNGQIFIYILTECVFFLYLCLFFIPFFPLVCFILFVGGFNCRVRVGIRAVGSEGHVCVCLRV